MLVTIAVNGEGVLEVQRHVLPCALVAEDFDLDPYVQPLVCRVGREDGGREAGSPWVQCLVTEARDEHG